MTEILFVGLSWQANLIPSSRPALSIALISFTFGLITSFLSDITLILHVVHLPLPPQIAWWDTLPILLASNIVVPFVINTDL